MADRTRVVVIGGGVVGCAILWELTRRGLPGVLLEANADVCEGTSKANSGIVHTGFDARPNTLEARLLVQARELWPRLVEDLGLPFLAVGAVMIARTAVDAERLRNVILPTAHRMDVPVQLLDRHGLRDLAPYAVEGEAGLSIPGESIIDPFWLTRAYAEAAVVGGSEVRLRHRVVGLAVDDDHVTVDVEGGERIIAEQVVDAAGLRADEVAALAGDTGVTLTPRKGQFLVSEEAFGVDRIVLPIPGPTGKGMLVTPIVFGGLLLGPTATDGTDKDDDGTDRSARDAILAACASLVPAIADAQPVRQFAGQRHVSDTGDFIIRRSTAGDRLWIVAGIRSTGISTSPAIANHVAAALLDVRGWPTRPRRGVVPPPVTLADEPGPIVCVCRSISRAEVAAAVSRPIPPTTLDGVKRRSGAGFGDCQGNLCALDAARVLAETQGCGLETVEQHRPGSWSWHPGAARPPGLRAIREDVADLPGRVQVVIVGGGAAGRAAATEVGTGLRTLVLERLPGAGSGDAWTVSGLVPEGGGWLVLAQSERGTREIQADVVIVATGGYGIPFEQRGIAARRPAGLMTADRAWRVLEAGLLPGTKVALVGTGRSADRINAALRAAGAQTWRIEEPPRAIRGSSRVDGVLARDGWLEVDTLVLADRMAPQTFLLRTLGLVDAVPGRAAPTEADGRLPLPGLWAAGCCVQPDIEHTRCAAAGAAVGRRVRASLRHRTRTQGRRTR